MESSLHPHISFLGDGMAKYVLMNLETGEFSNTWDDTIQGSVVDEKYMEYLKKAPQWKLIKFECVNDVNFEFCHLMRIVTNDIELNKRRTSKRFRKLYRN